MAKFWNKKGTKNGPDFFVRTKIFIDHFKQLTQLKQQKFTKKTSTVWKKMAKNSPKPYNVTTSNVFLTQKWPKRPKRPKQEFSQTQHCHSMIQSSCPQFLTKFQTNLMCGFKENVQKHDFLAKMAKFWTKKGSKNRPDFFSEQKFSLTIFKQ